MGHTIESEEFNGRLIDDNKNHIFKCEINIKIQQNEGNFVFIYLFIYLLWWKGRFNGDIKKVVMGVGFRFIEEKNGLLN